MTKTDPAPMAPPPRGEEEEEEEEDELWCPLEQSRDNTDWKIMTFALLTFADRALCP